MIQSLIVILMLSFSVTSRADDVTLNFSDADIRAVIGSVSQITGKNFIIDPRVKGKVTVVSKKPLNKKEVYNVFLSILQVHGFSTIPAGKAIKIVPDATAKQNSAPLISNIWEAPSDQLVTQVIEVENVNATQLVPILRPLVAQQGHLAAYAPTNMLIISDRLRNIRRILGMIKKMDKVTEAGIELVQLNYAFAPEIVRLLNNLNLTSGAKKGVSSPKIKLSADERTNSIILSGDKSTRLKYRNIISDLDTQVEASGNTHVVYLRYADASNLAKLLGSVGKELAKNSGKAAKGSKQTGSINIQADEESNALVITAPTRVFRSLRGVIEKLDIARAQVHIEAVIAEVSLDTSNELGVQWVIDGSNSGEPILASNFNGSGSSIASIAAGAIGDGLTLGLGELTNSGTNFLALVRALRGDAESNLLSTPSIVTIDNQEAEIVVGQNVPFVTGEFSGAGGSSGTITNPFRTIERQDIGISLKVKPQINEGNTITMDIEQEVSNISGSSTGAVDLVTNKRSLKTTVQLEDGELLVLGGLIDETLIDSEQKVPGLGDIPIIGALFRSTSKQKIKRNLLVFIKATILKDNEKARALSLGKYNLMREGQLKSRANDDDQPVLDDLMINDPASVQ